MGEMMDQRKANFKDLSDEDLYVGKAIQKAYIDVDEKGTEAAAATGKYSALKVCDVLFAYFPCQLKECSEIFELLKVMKSFSISRLFSWYNFIHG